ncbi:alpha-N-acetylgalactosaminide alpha-2,6-sialyltransferase 5-like [Diadema antillarum]|uniref:alpha-N-acetylgalactosaminide alpha-2,6-sialyltransferase 5-like n=1 Tax=Diadema antillarum TaxID=105358 RepID=UPI003A83880A
MDHLRYKLHKCLRPHRILAFTLCYTLTCFVCLSLYYDGTYRASTSPQFKVLANNASLASAAAAVTASQRQPAQSQLSLQQPEGARRNVSREILQLQDKADELQRQVEAQTAARQHPPKINWRDIAKGDMVKKTKVLSKNDYRHFADNRSLSYHCKRCAIVSSSGQLLGRGAGPEIDKNECVIRMNDAPTKGFEADVGTRTTARVIGHRNLGRVFAHQKDLQDQMFSNRSSEKVFIHWSYLTDIDADQVGEYALVMKLMEKYPKVDFVMFTPQKMKFAEKLFHQETDLTRRQARTWLSTGWYTMLLAMDVCDEINVYGMVSEDYCKDHPLEKVPYHYYDPLSKPECSYYHTSEVRLSSGHLFITEKAVFARWSHIYNIHFHHPQWTPRPYSVSDTLRTPFLLRYHIANNRLFSRHPLWKLYFHFAGIFYPLVH